MPTLIAGIIAVIVLYAALSAFRAADPRLLARVVKIAGGVLCLAVAAFTGIRGQLAVAIPIGIFGLGLLGWSPFDSGLMGRRTGSGAGGGFEGEDHGGSSGGREDLKGDAAGRRRRTAADGKMTAQEAYEILGLKPGARRDEIVQAHRSLIKKIHPDQGGTTYLAARVNEAKDVLLRTHQH